MEEAVLKLLRGGDATWEKAIQDHVAIIGSIGLISYHPYLR